MERMLWISLLLIQVLALSGCDGTPWEKSPPYPIKDSGFLAVNNNKIYWLDESRVLFVGFEGRKPKVPTKRETGIYIWNVDTGDIENYEKPAHGLCYFEDYISYLKGTPRIDEVVMKGHMGKEQPVLLEDHHLLLSNDSVRNSISCRINKRPQLMTGRIWVPLLEKHGYLDRGAMVLRVPKLEQKPWKAGEVIDFSEMKTQAKAVQESKYYVPADGRQPVKFPFSSGLFSYLPFSDSYFFGTLVTNDPGVCTMLWEMSVDGAFESECLPANNEKLGTASKKAIRTKIGTLVASSSIKPGDRIWKSGIYLFKNNDYLRLIPGITRNHGVSPSGCRIAFYHQLTIAHARIGEPGETTLKMIDLCTDSGKN